MAPKADTTTNITPPAGSAWTDEAVKAAIEAARTQEKDKLYGTIQAADAKVQGFEAELKELRKFQKAQEKAEAERQKAIADAQKAKEEAEMSSRQLLETRSAEFNARLEELQRENELRVAMLEKANEEATLRAYAQRRALEERDNIVPELIDFINGDTKESIDASIEDLKTRSAAIAEAARGARRQQQAGMPGVAPSSGTNGVTPLDQPGDRQYTAEDIKGMSMQEFSALRKRIGMPSGSGRGLFD